MKHSEFEAYIFVGTEIGTGVFHPSYILNNDKKLSISNLKCGEKAGYHKFNIKIENLFSVKEAEALLKGNLSKPLIHTVSYYKGENYRGEPEYKSSPVKVKFEAVRVNVDISCFNIDGLE